jgi:sugar transferase (PEP-CTERM/EpsH1 system associated)
MADLLFLTQRIPYPPIKGEKIRPLQILHHLRKTYDIHLGCLVDDPHDAQYIETVRNFCVSSHFAQIDRGRAKLTCLTGLLTGEPLSAVFYRDRGLANWVRHVLDNVRPDIIFVCSSNMAPYILDLKGKTPCLVDLADVDSEKWRAYAATTGFPMNFVYRREWRRVAELEARIARECDWSVFVSEEEAALFRGMQPQFQDKIRAVSNGVDLGYFDPARRFDAPYDASRPNFVFTGTMDYPPNVDAVTWFAKDILPFIRATMPDAQFHIVGGAPSPQVKALESIAGVFVTGRIADVRPHVAHATACVAPMRIARGIQNKVLEAMAMGRPTVVTSDALAGIGAVPGRELLLADTEADFAQACLACAEPDAAAIGRGARQRVLADYAWPEQLKRFDGFLNERKNAPVL